MNEFQSFFAQQRLMERRIQTFGEANALKDYRFDRDNGTVPKLEQARRYAAAWRQMQERSIGLLLWGQPGNGKTFAAACIANALIGEEGPDMPRVRMTTLGAVLNKLPALSPAEKRGYLEELVGCDLLILDDFGMERRTDYAREQIFALIDGRCLSKKPLILTTNLSLEQLKHPGDMADKRICDRVLEMCVPVCFEGESQRQQKGKEKLKLFQELTCE